MRARATSSRRATSSTSCSASETADRLAPEFSRLRSPLRRPEWAALSGAGGDRCQKACCGAPVATHRTPSPISIASTAARLSGRTTRSKHPAKSFLWQSCRLLCTSFARITDCVRASLGCQADTRDPVRLRGASRSQRASPQSQRETARRCRRPGPVRVDGRACRGSRFRFAGLLPGRLGAHPGRKLAGPDRDTGGHNRGRVLPEAGLRQRLDKRDGTRGPGDRRRPRSSRSR